MTGTCSATTPAPVIESSVRIASLMAEPGTTAACFDRPQEQCQTFCHFQKYVKSPGAPDQLPVCLESQHVLQYLQGSGLITDANDMQTWWRKQFTPYDLTRLQGFHLVSDFLKLCRHAIVTDFQARMLKLLDTHPDGQSANDSAIPAAFASVHGHDLDPRFSKHLTALQRQPHAS